MIDETQAADLILADVTAAVRYYAATHERPANLSDRQFLAHVMYDLFGYHPITRWVNEAKKEAGMVPVKEVANGSTAG